MPRLTLVTNFGYQATGREYAKEDLWLAGSLRRRGFQVATIHPNDLDTCDFISSEFVLWRNTGPVTTHSESFYRWRQFQTDGKDHGKLVNNFLLKGDLRGKQHLLDLTTLGVYPVIETQLVRSFLASRNSEDLMVLIKPMDGADSIGQQVLRASELAKLAEADSALYGFVAQRVVDFVYEVSFYIVGGTYVYALRTGSGPEGRWQLSPYTQEQNPATWEADMTFAMLFNKWNGRSRGVVRIDGVREATTGNLLLMEIEDYNPYLSLDLLPVSVQEIFADVLAESIKAK